MPLPRDLADIAYLRFVEAAALHAEACHGCVGIWVEDAEDGLGLKRADLPARVMRLFDWSRWT